MKNKVLPLPRVVEVVNLLRAEGKKIVTTNGCFDFLHLGHVDYLRAAKALGDILVVGVNSDASVKENKGDLRPVNGELARAEVLAALEMVDFAFLFGEKNPIAFLSLLKPDVHVKGGDYSGRIIEQDTVERAGGVVRLLPFTPGYSTTSLIERITKAYPSP